MPLCYDFHILIWNWVYSGLRDEMQGHRSASVETYCQTMLFNMFECETQGHDVRVVSHRAHFGSFTCREDLHTHTHVNVKSQLASFFVHVVYMLLMGSRSVHVQISFKTLVESMVQFVSKMFLEPPYMIYLS